MAAIVFVGGAGGTRSTDEEGYVSGHHTFSDDGGVPLSNIYLSAPPSQSAAPYVSSPTPRPPPPSPSPYSASSRAASSSSASPS